jgi:hypothetical protein
MDYIRRAILLVGAGVMNWQELEGQKKSSKIWRGKSKMGKKMECQKQNFP